MSLRIGNEVSLILFSRQFPDSPASSPTKKNMVRPDYEHQIYNLYTKSGQFLCSLSLRRHAHVTLAKRLMHIAHFSGNTSGMSKSSYDWLN